MSEPSVLIVDDDADIREMLELVLGAHHLHPIPASSGSEALARLHESPADFALILLDLMMPAMSGIEVLEQLKHDAQLASIPVIVLSGDRDAQYAATSRGAEGCLLKPVTMDALLHEVGRFVEVPPL